MSFYTSSALPPGGSAAFILGETWTSYTVAYSCSDASDTTASVTVQGSTDVGATWVPLAPTQSIAFSSTTDSGARVFSGIPVNAITVQAHCASGNTVTAALTGR